MNSFRSLKQDLPASVVVFFVAVPLCLGIALASGAPLMAGLIAGIIGGIVVGLLSGSAVGVSGPAAGLAVIVLATIADLGSFEAFLLAVVLAGAFQIALGLMKAGVLGYFFPSSVIKGMLAGIGVLIILKQIPHALGHDSDPEGDWAFLQTDGETTMTSLAKMLGDLSPTAIVISVCCLAILILWDKVLVKRSRAFSIFPGPLAAVTFGILLQLLLTWFAPEWALGTAHLVTVPVAGSVSEFLGFLSHPDWGQIANQGVWLAAVTLAVVASIETLLCLDAADKLDPLRRVAPANRELIAQGIGNMTSGLIGGLPITQVIIRSSANIQSGGRTKMSAILHGVLLLVFVIALPQLLNLIPLATLASILLVVGFKLAAPSLFKAMYAQGWAQFLPFIITILGIVFTDLLTGIAIGMNVAIFFILRAHYRNSHFLHIQKADEAGRQPKISIQLAEEVTFLNKGAIMRELKRIPDESLVTIDTSNSIFIDQDVLEIIEDFEKSAPSRSIQVERIEAAPGPRQGRHVLNQQLQEATR